MLADEDTLKAPDSMKLTVLELILVKTSGGRFVDARCTYVLLLM